jgi:hypothetical protein
MCTRISECVGVKFQGKEAKPATSLDHAKYQYVKLTATYEALPHACTPQFGTLPEYDRYTTILTKPYTENLSVAGGGLVYDTTTVRPGLSTNPLLHHPGNIIRYRKRLITLKWFQVPWEYLHNANEDPVKLALMEGTVNQVDFLGRPAGTLLCDGIDIERFTMPVATDRIDSLRYSANVTFTLKFWDPTVGDPDQGVRGWNLALGDDYPNHYAVKNSVTGRRPYEVYDFAKAFLHWSV